MTTITLSITLQTDDPQAAYADLAPEIDDLCERLGATWTSETYSVNGGEPADTVEIIL